MTTKTVLTLIGAIMSLQGIAIFFGAEAISEMAFASLGADETGLEIGAIMHKVLGSLNLSVGIIILSARSLPPAGGAKVLKGVALGLVIILARGFYDLFATTTKPPVPILVVMTILMVLAVVTARKAESESAAE